jgi:methylase of polypeptide subunit release factors
MPAKPPFALSAEQIAKFREALVKASFDEAQVAAACGVADVSQLARVSADEVWQRTAGGSTLETLVRLFVIGGAVPARDARRAIEPIAIDDAARGGLLRVSRDQAQAAIRITPCAGALVAFDRTWPGDEVEAPDFVMGPSETSRLLAYALWRTPAEDGLDLGAGSGFLAAVMAPHCRRVVATDVNRRAVAFSAFNAALNGLGNVEPLEGSLFEPVAERRFDRIVSNPPFVISPEDRLVYLNGGMKADGFCQRVAEGAGARLTEGGVMLMLCNWIEPDGADWKERLAGWFAASGCDAWVLRRSSADPESYARGWMKVGSVAGRVDPKRLAAWLDYYRAEGIAGIGGGLVIMRKRSGTNWFRVCDGPTGMNAGLGEALRGRLPALDFLADTADDAALMASYLEVSPAVRMIQECRPTHEGWAQETARITIDSGLAYTEAVDSYVGELVVACDGKRRLSEAIALTAAKLGWNAADVPDETADIVRQLVEEGFLVPVP